VWFFHCSSYRYSWQAFSGCPRNSRRRCQRFSPPEPESRRARWKAWGEPALPLAIASHPFDGILMNAFFRPLGPVQSEKEWRHLHFRESQATGWQFPATCSRSSAYVGALKHFNNFFRTSPGFALASVFRWRSACFSWRHPTFSRGINPILI